MRMKKGKERSRVINAARRFQDKKKQRKYRVTKKSKGRVSAGRYEDDYTVEDLSTGKRYKATKGYGPLGNTFWWVDKLKRKKKR